MSEKYYVVSESELDALVNAAYSEGANDLTPTYDSFYFPSAVGNM